MGTPRKKPIRVKKPPPPPTPKAAKPWDVRPFPKQGNWGPSKIHRSVGYALDEWGHAESYIGSVLAALIGTHDGKDATLRAYGSVITFRGRAEMLAAAAEVYYFKYPESESKKRFDDLLEAALGFSSRRNEIAHGIVSVYGWFVPGRSKRRFVLGPSHYATNKRKITAVAKPVHSSHHLMPTYLYSSVEIDAFARAFRNLNNHAAEVYEALRAEATERAESIASKT